MRSHFGLSVFTIHTLNLLTTVHNLCISGFNPLTPLKKTSFKNFLNPRSFSKLIINIILTTKNVCVRRRTCTQTKNPTDRSLDFNRNSQKYVFFFLYKLALCSLYVEFYAHKWLTAVKCKKKQYFYCVCYRSITDDRRHKKDRTAHTTVRLAICTNEYCWSASDKCVSWFTRSLTLRSAVLKHDDDSYTLSSCWIKWMNMCGTTGNGMSF